MARVFVITGPSGVGKGTLIRALRERIPELELSVSATTRAPRPGETDGVDYNFLSGSQFDARVAAGLGFALLVAGVTADSPASAAGLLVGDVLLALNGQSLASPDDLLDMLVGDIVGTAVVVQVLRGGQLVDVTLTVGERPGR